ncbi:hypothetical protein FO519_000112 [Halicephalobus sp. NKZ332]|nr:hypothetical protein FO519_000112 [Halicephalobus sp. NKZ332]
MTYYISSMNININAIHVITFVGEVGTVVLCSILLRALHINSSYLRKECGNHVKSIVLVAILCGLSSMPSSIVLLSYGNINCPQILLVLVSLPRILTMRFEITQYTCMSVDRAASTILQRTYYKKFRKWSFRMSLIVSGVFSFLDLIFYLVRDKFDKILDHCSSFDAAGPSYGFYFFIINIFCLGISSSCYIFYFYDTRMHLKTSSVSTMITVRLVINMLGFFVLLFGIPTILLTLNRIFHFEFLQNLGNYLDAFLQMQHVLMFFIFCFTIDNKRLKQVSITSTITGTQTTSRNQKSPGNQTTSKNSKPLGNSNLPRTISRDSPARKNETPAS